MAFDGWPSGCSKATGGAVTYGKVDISSSIPTNHVFCFGFGTSADGKPMLVADQVVTNLKERYNSILSLAAVPSITNGKGKLFSVVDTYIYWLMTMARAILVCISQKQLSM